MTAIPASRFAPLAWLALVLGLTACGGDLETGLYQAAITNGTTDRGHVAVGEVRAVVSGESTPRICTGTVIGAQSVLTAAHCVVGVTNVTFRLEGDIQPSSSVVSGDYEGQVVEVTVHPGHEVRTTEVLHDLAVLRVWPPAPVAPALLSDGAPRPGTPTTLVGFGLTATTANDQGTKRSAPSVVATVDAVRIGFEAAGPGRGGFCLGDSGAPVLVQEGGKEVQIGVHSYLLNPDGNPCAHGARAMRVDAYLPWIRQATKGDMSAQGASILAIDDANPPRVTITEPLHDSVVSTRMVVRAQIVDDVALRTVALFVDDQQMGTLGTPPYAFSVDLLPGSHRIAIVAEDAAGNMTRSEVAITSVSGNPAEQSGGGCAMIAGAEGQAPVRGAVVWLLVLLTVAVAARRRSS